MTDFSHLFSSFQLLGLSVKNRIVMAPIDTNLADDQGNVTDDLLAFYERRAKGGVGILIVENSQVDFPVGKNTKRQLSIHEDAKIHGLKKLSDLIRREGAHPAIQIHHAGRETTLDVTGGMTPVAPSPIPCGYLQTPVRELRKSEIEEIIEKFVAAALRGQKAGFDLVEIHGAHGYLVGEFLSPYTNRRTDEYGKGFEGRMRFAVRIVHGIKETLGRDFPLSFRFSADEFVKGGIDVSEAQKIGGALEKAGVDVLHVSAGIYESLPTLLEPMAYAQGWRTHLAAALKEAVSIPVIAVGVIREPSFAEEVLAKGRADFVAIGRGLLADPDWPNKAMEGRVDELRKCIGCNVGCLSKRLTHAIECSVNAETGHERQVRIFPIKKATRRLTVIGGGPAGLEAARVGALRGFRVTLIEKEERLGGQMRLASVPPGKDKIRWIIEYYERQMSLLDITLHLGLKAEVEAVMATEPDAVILATGSTPVPCPFNPSVFTSDKVFSDPSSLSGGEAAIIGGGSIGCETALFLHERHYGVSVFEQLGNVAHDMEPISAWDLKDRMAKAKILTHVKSQVVDLQGGRVAVLQQDGRIAFGPFDLIVWAAGRKPTTPLVEALRRTSYKRPVRVIGDAAGVGKIHDAVHQGYATVKDL
jgi:2,4-dienoyl-CoA reductase-like NADH-dependent reductase (Old Yellow Enzyme family)/thioredoxin reductase